MKITIEADLNATQAKTFIVKWSIRLIVSVFSLGTCAFIIGLSAQYIENQPRVKQDAKREAANSFLTACNAEKVEAAYEKRQTEKAQRNADVAHEITVLRFDTTISKQDKLTREILLRSESSTSIPSPNDFPSPPVPQDVLDKTDINAPCPT